MVQGLEIAYYQSQRSQCSFDYILVISKMIHKMAMLISRASHANLLSQTTAKKPSLFSQTSPYIRPAFSPKPFLIFSPHPRSLNICRALVVRAAQHTYNTQQYRLGSLYR